MDALKFFDAYSLRARLFPALITSVSAIILLIVVIPWHRLSWTQAFASVGVIVILYVMADIARRRGRAIEPELIRRMGGLPSTTMLRYRDTTFDAGAKGRMHKFLGGKIGGKAPSAADEQKDPEMADKFYARCGNWLRENTRNHKKFNVLFDENITYGFRRNLLGLKLPSLIIDSLIVVGLPDFPMAHLPDRLGRGSPTKARPRSRRRDPARSLYGSVHRGEERLRSRADIWAPALAEL